MRSTRISAAAAVWLLVASLPALLMGTTWLALAQGLTGSTSAVTPYTVRGKVIDASSGAGVARALVTIGARSVLTDFQGNFELPQFSEAAAPAIRVQKPGFTSNVNPQDPPVTSGLDLTQPLVVQIYPDAVISGTVTGPNGEPLDRLYVQVERAQYDATGVHPAGAGSSVTDSRGRFRFRVAPGQYKLRVRYTPDRDRNKQAVVPVSFPANSQSGEQGYFRLAAGEQKVVDLRPPVGQTYLLVVKPDGADVQFGIQMTATNAAGESFVLGPQTAAGEARINLPSGSYVLRATSERQDQTFEGFAKVTVAGHDVAGVPLHMAPAAVLPVEVSADLAAVPGNARQVASNAPAPQQLNVFLHPQTGVSDFSIADVRIIPRATGQAEFHVPAGRYRLHGFASGSWWIESATCGQTNLLTSELVVASGSGGSTVRIVATNRSGRISGTVQPATSDPAGTIPQGWVYLVSESPSLVPYFKVRISRRGTYAATLMPGHYFAVAIPHSLEADLTDPAVATQFSRLGQTVEITDAGQASVDLPLASLDAKETQ